MLWHAADVTEQVRRLRRHRGHPHEAPEDGHRPRRFHPKAGGIKGCNIITAPNKLPIQHNEDLTLVLIFP